MRQTSSGPRVVVAMSGGVDSSVAAWLLHSQGYQVIGVTMRLWSSDTLAEAADHQGCCSVDDVADARRVCQLIGAPHYFLDFEREFRAYVMDYFVAEYQRGRTPHPCIACNDRMKFDFLLQRAHFMEADHVATGHYARIQQDPASGHHRLLRGMDAGKDQSYVLFNLTQPAMAHLLFPIGEYPKDEVRTIAHKAGLPVADKPDSQEICFIPRGDYRQFLSRQVEPQSGELVDTDGRTLGTHPGIEFFTVGQRRGLGVATRGRRFVVRVEPDTRRVVLGTEQDLLQDQVDVSKVNYVSGTAPDGPLRVTAKLRYMAPASPATLHPAGRKAVLEFETPQRAVTPGQAAVFYMGDELLGGGFIEQTGAGNLSQSN